MELPKDTVIHPGTPIRRPSSESGSTTRSSASGGARPRGHRKPVPRWASRRRWSCSARTTTAARRHGCAGGREGRHRPRLAGAAGRVDRRLARRAESGCRCDGGLNIDGYGARERRRSPPPACAAPRPWANSRRPRPSSSSGRAPRIDAQRGGRRSGDGPPAAGDGQADRRGARNDEGRRDEARAGDLVPRRRPRPARSTARSSSTSSRSCATPRRRCPSSR